MQKRSENPAETKAKKSTSKFLAEFPTSGLAIRATRAASSFNEPRISSVGAHEAFAQQLDQWLSLATVLRCNWLIVEPFDPGWNKLVICKASEFRKDRVGPAFRINAHLRRLLKRFYR